MEFPNCPLSSKPFLASSGDLTTAPSPSATTFTPCCHTLPTTTASSHSQRCTTAMRYLFSNITATANSGSLPTTTTAANSSSLPTTTITTSTAAANFSSLPTTTITTATASANSSSLPTITIITATSVTLHYLCHSPNTASSTTLHYLCCSPGTTFSTALHYLRLSTSFTPTGSLSAAAITSDYAICPYAYFYTSSIATFISHSTTTITTGDAFPCSNPTSPYSGPTASNWPLPPPLSFSLPSPPLPLVLSPPPKLPGGFTATVTPPPLLSGGTPGFTSSPLPLLGGGAPGITGSPPSPPLSGGGAAHPFTSSSFRWRSPRNYRYISSAASYQHPTLATNSMVFAA